MNNKISKRYLAVSFVAIAVSLSACVSLQRRSPPRINFTGIWNISHEMSGNPATLPGLDAAKPSANGDKAGPGAEIMAQLMSQQLRIRQTKTETTIDYGDGIKKTYDWGKFAYRKTKSGWKKNHFVIRRPGPGGHMLVRWFILSDAGHSITVVTLFNQMAMSQLYELDKAATRKAFGKLVSVKSYDS